MNRHSIKIQGDADRIGVVVSCPAVLVGSLRFGSKAGFPSGRVTCLNADGFPDHHELMRRSRIGATAGGGLQHSSSQNKSKHDFVLELGDARPLQKARVTTP